MIPFFIFYSMFGFQRIGDLIWAGADMQSKGFLLGATSGRTTLNGEGLQHQDGHSHLVASTVPNCVAYDPTFAYELAVIMQDGLRRMYAENERIFYYITLMNEAYHHDAIPEGVEAGIRKGMYLLREASDDGGDPPRVQLLGSGAILREVIAAADLLAADFGVAADLWSVPSFNELRRDGMACERWNRLHPGEEARRSHVEECFAGRSGPFVASTDYVRSVAEQIRPWVPGSYTTLGTEGFGRSDTRARLRCFFEVDRHHVVVAALAALAAARAVPPEKVAEAIGKYGIDAETPEPWTVRPETA
jgi:pyruvate dehydrogenase E1 component